MPVALITGAAGGIGHAAACEFASQGYDLVLADISPAIEPKGSNCLSLCLDLTDEAAVSLAVEKTDRAFGRLDALVNIAGINHRSGIRSMQLSDWTRLLDINVGAMFLTAKHCTPLLLESGAAAIVNMASISGHVASRDYPAYVTSKAAVEGLTRALAKELFDRRIRVNAVAPGWVDAGFTQEALDNSDTPQDLLDAARKAHVLGRMARPDEIARTIQWLASPSAMGINGEVLFVDGGLMRVH